MGALLALAAQGWAEEDAPKELSGVEIDEHLGEYVDASVVLTDHRGREVRLQDYLDDDKPVLLTLNYYRCETLCSLQLNGLVEGLRGVEWTPGEEFHVVTVSIDHRESFELAAGKRAAYLEEYGRGEVGWEFLVGSQPAVERLAKSVGFGFRYVPEQDQYAHIAVAMFLAPDGKIVRYIYGLEYRPFDLRMGLQEAADGTIGDPLERIIFSCFHYDAEAGKYSVWAFGVMRLGGAVVLVFVGGFLAFLWWRDARNKRRSQVG